jgi:XTP/dITP diphosphohydrolase
MIPARVVLATRNRGKLAELGALVRAQAPVEVISLDAFPDVPEVEERGASYVENAIAKARAAASASGLPALADDSGLEVDALDGGPGIRSARYAGPGADDGDRISVLLGALAGIPADARGARFRCVLALVWPDGRVVTGEGECPGRIALAPEGSGGFGYDPIFVPDALGRTFAAASAGEKLRLSHRTRAMEALFARLRGS